MNDPKKQVQTTDTDEGTPVIEPEQETPATLDVDDTSVDLSKIDEMSDEEIMKLNVDPSIDDDLENTDDQTIEDNADEKSQTTATDKTTDSKNQGKDTENQQVDYEKRYKDLQSAYTKSQQKLKEYREKLTQKERDALDSFEQLTDDEKQELKVDDPEAYADYIIAEREHEQQVRQLEQSTQSEWMEHQKNQILDFAKDVGVNLDDEKAVEKFFQSDKFKKVDEFVLNNYKRDNKTNLYTAEQMLAAYNHLFFDDIVQSRLANESGKIRYQTINEIERAQRGGSDFDRLSPEGDVNEKRNVGDLSIDDIDAMSEEQVSKLLDEMPLVE